MLRFFGIYYGVVGGTTIAMQLLLTGRLLERRNVSLPILLMPVLLVGVALSFVVGAGLLIVFAAATFGKSLEAWRRSVHDTTINVLYTKIERRKRRATISLNNGVIKPLAEVLASSVILFGAATVYRPLFFVVLVIWILAASKLIQLAGSTRRKRASASVHQRKPSKIADGVMVPE